MIEEMTKRMIGQIRGMKGVLEDLEEGFVADDW